jgi:hypothetical protein
MIWEWGENQEHAAVAFNDLCRLARGMRDKERRDVVKATVGQMQTLWEKHAATVDMNGRFAQRVLGEIDRKWAQPGMRAATDACRQVIRLTAST